MLELQQMIGSTKENESHRELSIHIFIKKSHLEFVTT